MSGHRALYGALSVGLVVVILIVVLATRSVAPGAPLPGRLDGTIAPPISGRAVLGDEQVSLAALRGRYVFVDFFASWCSTCVAEAPEIESFLFTHRSDKDVAVLGVDISDSAPNAIAFLRRTGATFPSIVDHNDLIAQSYGVASPPAVFLIDPNGKVATSFTTALSASYMDQLIATRVKAS